MPAPIRRADGSVENAGPTFGPPDFRGQAAVLNDVGGYVHLEDSYTKLTEGQTGSAPTQRLNAADLPNSNSSLERASIRFNDRGTVAIGRTAHAHGLWVQQRDGTPQQVRANQQWMGPEYARFFKLNNDDQLAAIDSERTLHEHAGGQTSAVAENVRGFDLNDRNELAWSDGAGIYLRDGGGVRELTDGAGGALVNAQSLDLNERGDLAWIEPRELRRPAPLFGTYVADRVRLRAADGTITSFDLTEFFSRAASASRSSSTCNSTITATSRPRS